MKPFAVEPGSKPGSNPSIVAECILFNSSSDVSKPDGTGLVSNYRPNSIQLFQAREKNSSWSRNGLCHFLFTQGLEFIVPKWQYVVTLENLLIICVMRFHFNKTSGGF